jgi:hypothetical protein
LKPSKLESYGALNVSLVSDLPLFIDPFLLFNSKKRVYKKLHDDIIRYLEFLRDKATDGVKLDEGHIKAWYKFSEVKQNCLGFAQVGSAGLGLGSDFAHALYVNLGKLFGDFGAEKITHGSHLEKLCLISEGVGRDKISDFTTNLIKEYLLEYTEAFAKKYIDRKYKKRLRVTRVKFNYKTESWMERTYTLPVYRGDYILLTPKALLTMDETWINKTDLVESFSDVPMAIENTTLRAQVDNYFRSRLPKKNVKKRDEKNAAIATILEFPELIDYYIRLKEMRGDKAVGISSNKVKYCEEVFIQNVHGFLEAISKIVPAISEKDAFNQAVERLNFLKHVIENNDGYRLFYRNGKNIAQEKYLHILFKLLWFGTSFSVDSEVNNGRGPVDFKISKGELSKALVEFKLASNSHLKMNLAKQVEVYKKANRTEWGIKVIVYFSKDQQRDVEKILADLRLTDRKEVILIDARKDNKESASTVV